MNFDVVPANIIRYMRMLEISMAQMAAAIGMSERSLYRRFKTPKEFTLEEISTVCKVCKTTLKNIFMEVD